MTAQIGNDVFRLGREDVVFILKIVLPNQGHKPLRLQGRKFREHNRIYILEVRVFVFLGQIVVYNAWRLQHIANIVDMEYRLHRPESKLYPYISVNNNHRNSRKK
jgi:hypothetical protein